MKIKKVLTLLAFFLSSALVYAQNVNLHAQGVTVKRAMTMLQQKSGYFFVYDQSDIDLKKKVNVNATTVTQALSQIFSGQNVSYEVNGKNVILSKKARKATTQSSTRQGKTVKCTGHIVDQDGEPIIGASVRQVGANNGAVTDIDGNFTLDVPEGTPLLISYIGFKDQRIPASGRMNVRMMSDTNDLNEVVVVGYGTQKKVNLTGSVSSVSTKDLTNRVENNVLSAIQGTVPGVTVISRPGSTPSINFRGRGNLGTSAPLYVIDGVVADATFFQNLDPESIESISFLKDAASSAIYGSRAAYGVVLVTTKKGGKERMNISYNGMVGSKTPTYLPKLINSAEYATLLNEARYNVNPSGGKNQAYTDDEIEQFRNGTNPDYYPNTDWIDLTMDKHVVTTQHSLNFSGGGKTVQYYLGGGYLYNDSFVRGRNDYRYNLDMSISADLRPWLKVRGGAKYIRNERKTDRGIPSFTSLLLVPSIMVARQSNGEWGSIAGGKQATQTFIQNNPLRTLSKKDWTNMNYENALYSLGADLKPMKGLTISADGSYKRYEYKYKTYSALQDAVNHFETGNPISGTSVDINRMNVNWSSNTRLQGSLTAHYDFTISKDHAFNILLGTSYEKYTNESLSASRRNFPSDSYKDLSGGSSAGTDISNGSGMGEYKLMSYFGRINYAYADKYLFEANLRTDGSSRFYKSNRWGWFPSFSAGWRISEEPFMKQYRWLDNLKLRASYGTLGNINNVGNYDYFQLYSKSGYYSFDNTLVEGIMESKPANKSLTWEKVSIADWGLDIDLFNHLNVVFDYYLKNTSNILLAYNVPTETGIINSPSSNIGKVRNSGFELGLTYRNSVKDFWYQVGANMSYNKNKITDLSGSDNMVQSGGDKIRYILKEGESIGSFYGFKTDGLYTQEEIDAGHYYTFGRKPNAGDIKYVPQRSDVKWGDAITDDDRTIIGCDVPKFTYGINLNLGYKDFELDVLGQGVSGAKVAFESEQVWAFFLNSNPREFHLGRWTESNPNPHAAYPRIYGGTSYDTYNQNFSDYQLFDADYFRFKTITLGYRLPRQLTARLGMSSLRFFLTGENLITIRADHKMKDFDPESLSGRSVYAFGEKSVAFGINVEF